MECFVPLLQLISSCQNRPWEASSRELSDPPPLLASPGPSETLSDRQSDLCPPLPRLAFPGLYSSVGARTENLCPLFLSWFLQNQTEPVETGRGRCSPIYHGYCSSGQSLGSHPGETVPPISTQVTKDRTVLGFLGWGIFTHSSKTSIHRI